MKTFMNFGEIDIAPLTLSLKQNPHLWNQHIARRDAHESPHSEMSDIWIRYNDINKFKDGDLSKINDEHFPIWYPAYKVLPQLRNIIFGLMARLEAEHLGGVLITKIPPGGKIAPHADKGWHVGFYNTKLYVVLESNPFCINRVEDDHVIMKPGEVWYFDNTKEHEVINNGETDRITLIICMRREG